MNHRKYFLLFFILMGVAATSFSQNNKFIDSIPTTKAGYIRTEPAVIYTIDWLENSPIDQQVARRKQLNAKLLAWLAHSPTVTISVNEKTTPFTKKNPELLFIFMGGWTKYSLQHGYSKDTVKCTVAGIKSAIKVYQMGNGLVKDGEMEKIISIDAINQLEAWVRSQMGVK